MDKMNPEGGRERIDELPAFRFSGVTGYIMAVVGVNVLGDHPQRHPLDIEIRRAMARSAEELCPWTQPSYTSPPFLNSTFTNKSRATRRGRMRAIASFANLG